MAKNKGPNLPTGFEPLTSSRVEGWFVLEGGNVAQGFMEDSFVIDGEFGKKRVFKIKLSEPDTKCIGEDGEPFMAAAGTVIGIDEKGWLKALGGVEKGREVYIRCDGREEKARRKGQSPAWLFTLGVVPI